MAMPFPGTIHGSLKSFFTEDVNVFFYYYFNTKIFYIFKIKNTMWQKRQDKKKLTNKIRQSN